MNKLILIVMAAGASTLVAQPRLIVTAPAAAAPGDNVAVVLSVDSLAGTDVVALQWTNPGGVTISGPQPSIPDKSVVCSLATCMVIGATPAPVAGAFVAGTVFNAYPLRDAQVQTFTFAIPSAAKPGDTITISPTATLGATPNGAATAVTIVPASVTIRHPLDLDGSGTVDASDAQIALTRWLATRSKLDFAVLVQVAAKLQP